MIVVAILGTRSRLRYARRIFDAQTKGAFTDMNSPEAKSRSRRLAFLALIGTVGTIISFVILVIPRLNWIPVPIVFTAFCVFGIIAAIAGFLMQREIDRRL
jgi:hypothetical protein